MKFTALADKALLKTDQTIQKGETDNWANTPTYFIVFLRQN